MNEAATYRTREDDGREGRRTVRLRVPAAADNAALARLALSGVAGLAGAPGQALDELKLAVTEAVGLAVSHAIARGSGHVEVVYELGAAGLRVEVADEGVVFDAAREAVPVELATERIARLVDVVEVDRRPGSGELRLRLVKHLRAAV